MAIVEMKKMRLVALKHDRAKILHQLQKLAAVEIIKGDAQELGEYASGDASRFDDLQKQVARLDTAISKLNPYDKEKASLITPKPVRTSDDAMQALAAKNDVLEVVKRLEEIDRTRNDLRAREAKENAQIAQLSLWEGLDVPLEEIQDTNNAVVRLLSVPAKSREAFTDAFGAFQITPAFNEVSSDRDSVRALFACHISDRDAYIEAMRANGVTEVAFGGVQGTPALVIDQLQGRLARLSEVRAQLARETESLAAHNGALKTLRDVYYIESKQYEAAARFAETESSFMLTAWVPESSQEKIQKAIERVTGSYAVEFVDPTEDEKPPTFLRNKGVIGAFETIVNMYSTPDPRGLDPTFIMMPFYACFFGLMLSDAAYGIILGILTGFVAYKLRGKGGMGALMAVLAVSSVATFFWGGMLGGWFGIEDIKPWIGFTPMSEPLKMMGLCLGLGVFQILVGMGIAMYMKIRRGHVLDALFDQGLWLVAFAGIGLIFVSRQLGLAVMIAGAAGIVLTAGRKKKSFFGKITGGLGALYNVTGYLSDVLSYARLFGMGLATGVIAMVFNKVAMMMWGGVGTIFALIILIVGHVFNLGINTLGAYVHACRLQYIEFFGKFYEDGGVLFKPLDGTGKYMDFADGDKAA